MYHILIGLVLVLAGFIPKLSRTIKILDVLKTPSDHASRFIIRGFFPAIGSLFITITLWILDPIFLSLGKLKRLGRPPDKI